MRIDRLQVDSFGRLAGLDTGPEPLGDLVVVLGPNEAGKSTLFHFLTTALYGFQPASRERSPWIPWGGDEAGGRVGLRLSDGGCVEVERRLRSQPHGQVVMGDSTQDVRNRPLPWVEHVPRAVFRQVYALTLADLAGLDEETWARIQDRVVGSMGASDLLPARDAAEALEREAGELWRPNRRGNQAIRELQQRIRDLRERRREALERDREIRALVEERESARALLRDRREDRQREREVVERVRSLLPLRGQLRRIAGLRAEGGPREQLGGLPPDPRSRFDAVEGERLKLEERLRALDAERVEPEAAIDAFDPAAARLLDRRDEIARLESRASSIRSDRSRLRELKEEVADLERALDVQAASLLTVPWKDAPRSALLELPVDILRDRAARATDARSALEVSGARPAPTTPASAQDARSTPPPSASAVLLALGLGLLGWRLLGGPPWAATAGIATSAVALVLLWQGLSRTPSRSPRDRPDAGATTDVLLAASAAARRGVVELVGDLPLLAEHVERPGSPLVAAVERLQELAREHARRTEAVAGAADRLEAADREGLSLAIEVGLGAGSTTEDLASLLSARLRRAERLADAAEAARRDLARLDRERDAAARRLDAVRLECSNLAARATSAGGGDLQGGLHALTARLQAHQRADQLEDELERAHPDLEMLRARIVEAERAGESWTADPEELARRQAEIEGLGEVIEDLVSRVEALDQRAAHLRDLPTPDAVDSEIAGLQEEEAERVRARDRSWVLAQLLREADRRFRDEHQPDLMRRAGCHLEHLTAGRYDRLVVDETSRGDLFHVVGPGLPAPVPLTPPISTGTLEQAYLSLRLAIVDHLDRGGETLPLFIDEVFVNWDRERRERGIEVLRTLAGTRQLFVFTCHAEVAEELNVAGARILELHREE